MSDRSAIEWTDATWNVVNGCSVTSPGCTNCYAMRLAGTRLRNHLSRAGLTRTVNGNPVWTGETRFNDKVLLDPLRWRRPRRIFVCAHGDLFHESVPDEWIDCVFAVMALAGHHTFQVLTKRPERMRAYLTDPAMPERVNAVLDAMLEEHGCKPLWGGSYDDAEDRLRGGPLPNVWLGTSVEDQTRADERVHHLLSTPAAVRWLSAEPLLGLIDLRHLQPGDPPTEIDALAGRHGVIRPHRGECERIDWVVAGGESGPNARPMHPDWARSLRDQCAAAGVAFLFKQWGEWSPDDGPPASGRDTIFEGAARAAVRVDDAWQYLDNGFQGPVEWCERPSNWLFRLGKKRAGRLLDGVQHDGYPA